MSLSTIDGDFRVNGTISAQRFNPPAGSITDAAVIAGANIQATKVIHQLAIHYEQDPAGAVIAATKLVHTVHGSNATLVAVDVMTTTPATGADRTVTVDLQKGNASSAFASVLGAPVTLNNATVARAPVEGSIASGALVDDDTLQLVITVAGVAGAQAQGLLVTITLQEYPN